MRRDKRRCRQQSGRLAHSVQSGSHAGPVPSASIDDLLAHAGWLRRLARHLVRDADLAEDVTQETWVSATRAPPERGRPARPWLAQVLRNVVRMRARSERQRRRWESAGDGAVLAAVSSPQAAQERLELHRQVVEIVLGLEEPFRTTVLLRFFEERSSAEIARILDVPAGTVRWRLKKAIEQLRSGLDGRFGGDRRRWSLLLAPASRRLPLAGAAKGALLMAKIKTSTAGLVRCCWRCSAAGSGWGGGRSGSWREAGIPALRGRAQAAASDRRSPPGGP